jgi:hypothetical protein
MGNRTNYLETQKMSGSGGGQSGDTTVNWNPSMQPRMDNYLNLMERSLFPQGVDHTYQDLSQFKPYTGQRFAGPAYGERQAIANSSFLSDLAPSPVGSMTAASQMTQDTLRGKYQDPYADQTNAWSGTNPTVGRNSWAGTNPTVERNTWEGTNPTVERNQYSGTSPYYQAIKQQGMDDIALNYQKTTQSDLARQAAAAGAFVGDSGYQRAQSDNQAALGKTLANYDSQMDQGQYDRSANLEQQYLNSNLQNQQNNKVLGGNWQQQYLNNNLQNQQNNKLLGGNWEQQYLNNDLQNQQNNKQLGWQSTENQLNRGSSAYQNERQRQMGAAGLGYGEQGLALDRMGMNMQTGALDRQLGNPYQGIPGQKKLDFNFSQQQDQNNWPFKILQMLGGQYGSAMGNTSQTTQAYGGNGNLGGILGGLLGGYALSQ